MRSHAVIRPLIAGLMLTVIGCGAEQPQPPAQSASARPEPTTTAPSPAETGDPARYCRLTDQLKASGRKTFAGLGRDATHAEYRSAERRFVLDNATALRGLKAALPERLGDDVRTFVTAMRQRGGLEPAGSVTQADASAAEQALRGYERRACGH
ncbi:MAG: hypothetical protein M3419_08155 [Actinomycetota bacterium]|nr:hypothetical protein [Actinomycetota bacterium]